MIAQIKNKYLEVSAKTHGAELTSIKKLDGCTEFLWQGDEAYWSSRSPILFPIVGGLPDGKYEVNHKIYNVEAHGFAKDSEFLLVAESETEL
jgi:galactose mutarotase-like enzyme